MMCRKLKHNFGLLTFSLLLLADPVLADPPLQVYEVLSVLGMDKGQIAKLVEAQPLSYALSEGRSDEVAVAVVWYLPVPLAKVSEYLRLENSGSLDEDVADYGLLTEKDGTNSLTPIALSNEDTMALLEAERGDEFNLSAHEYASFKALKKTLKHSPHKNIDSEVGLHYRDILFQRFLAYRQGGSYAIAPYLREDGLDSKPSLELNQAANESAILKRYFPNLLEAWLDYPKTLPLGAKETFPWVKKNVEGRVATILRHRIDTDWNGGTLILTREFYASHSYNASQWITGCLPYRDGTVIFQQVRSYTDQVAGVASGVKHLVGRELLKDKMLKYFKRLCGVLGQCE